MTTTVSVTFTADATGVTLDTGNDHSRSVGLVAGGATEDLKHKDPLAWAAFTEFDTLGTTSGVITISAV